MVSEHLIWDKESEAYIRSRSTRYAGGFDIEPKWTPQEVLQDEGLAAFEPDPKSRMGAARFIGHSPSADRVLVVIAYRDSDGDLHGVNAWPSSGADLRVYKEGDNCGEED